MQNNFSQFYFTEDNNNLIIVYRAISGRESGDKVLVTSNKDTALLHAKQYKRKLEKYKVDKNDLEPGSEALAFYDGEVPSIEKAVEIEALVDPKKLTKLSTLYYSDTLGKFVSVPEESLDYGDEDENPIRVKAREKSQKVPKIMFARWGGMNPKRDKEKEKSFSNPFHTPPEHRGIYAFIWPYIESFLAAWNKNMMNKVGTDEYGETKYRFPPIKKFQHHGDIWCHFVEEAKKLGVGKDYQGSWVKVHTKDLPMLLGKVIAKDIKSIKQPNFFEPKGYKDVVKDPYKLGRSGVPTMTKDHLEVFIPGKVKETKEK